jgi:hypothetical protein
MLFATQIVQVTSEASARPINCFYYGIGMLEYAPSRKVLRQFTDGNRGFSRGLVLAKCK